MNWHDVCISESSSIVKAIEIIDRAGAQLALVTDEKGRLMGTVTDGDVRRGLLKGISLNDSVTAIMNPKPITMTTPVSEKKMLKVMREKVIRQMPILNREGIVVDLKVLDDLLQRAFRANTVVLMVGGEGKRLMPLTKETPKPLLKVGDKPLLEIIIENFLDQGFNDFFFCVNYKAEQILEHFGDGSKWGAAIRYVQEDQPLGTAGPLALLPEKPSEPFIVMNGDLLTKVNFSQLLDFHESSKACATMCVREYEFQLPYGMVTLEDQKISRLEEKPKYNFFVNSGIYVLESDVLELVPRDRYYDMTDLFSHLVEKGYSTAAFPLREYWIDVGRPEDFEKANFEITGGAK